MKTMGCRDNSKKTGRLSGLRRKKRNVMKALGAAWLFVFLLAGCAWGSDRADVPRADGLILEIDESGNARLDITVRDFFEAGFRLGDVVTVSAAPYTCDMPFLDGYYVEKGEPMVRALVHDTYLVVSVKYGSFSDEAGVSEGDPIELTLKEEAGALELQEINSLVYTDEREDYASDEIFANFRPITAGEIAEGILYRSASPVNNKYGRAAYADALAEDAKIRTVMNMSNTDEEIEKLCEAEDFQSDYYKSLYDNGDVIALSLPVDFVSYKFGEGVVEGLTFLSRRDGPYLVHCEEGKDRSGFACMILEALMGADADSIRADYMRTYENYYGLEPGTEKYNAIEKKNIDAMMRQIAGLGEEDPLDGADLEAAAEGYLTGHGMSVEAIRVLQAKLAGQ